jgi:Bacterial extracellular solute-binding proteins, family 3
MKYLGIYAVIAALAVVPPQSPQARAQDSRQPEARELVIGTKVAPPFAMKAEDGTWHGISIDLWRRIADQMHLRYRFQETTLKGLIDGVGDGSLDASVAALTVTSSREHVVDFTQPFYSTGLGIAVASVPASPGGQSYATCFPSVYFALPSYYSQPRFLLASYSGSSSAVTTSILALIGVALAQASGGRRRR